MQRFLDQRGRSLIVMQSDNIFTVGGTLSVNAHGWHPLSGPAASTVESFRLTLASGETRTCSRRENADLFRATLGGYGLFGVILEARLRTMPNVAYRKTSRFFPSHGYPRQFREHVVKNPAVGLAYGRLSVDDDHFLSEAGLYVYEVSPKQPAPLPPMTDESLVPIKREIFRASERSDAGKRRRWLIERRVGPMLEGDGLTRNTVMNADIHSLWPTDPGKRDILQEYFVPREKFVPFVEGLARLVRAHGLNLLNVTIRDVSRDDDTLLAYAREDVFAFVLLFSQEATPAGEDAMGRLTRDLVDHSLALGGTFYLPYRLHYTVEQFRKAYPGADAFFAIKGRYDPGTLFSSRFYGHITSGGVEGP